MAMDALFGYAQKLSMDVDLHIDESDDSGDVHYVVCANPCPKQAPLVSKTAMYLTIAVHSRCKIRLHNMASANS